MYPPSSPALLAAFAFLAIALVMGCSESHVFDREIQIESGEWHYADTIVYQFEIADTSKLYSLSLDLTHGIDYPYQNLYVKFYTTFPSGKTESQVVSLELTEKGTFWLGKCRGDRCTIRIPLQAKTWFPDPGLYKLKMEQYMRIDPIPEIYSMRLIVDEWKKEDSRSPM